MSAQVAAALFGGAAAGAVLNQLFGLLAGWIGRRHEKRRWLLEKQIEAYTAFNAAYRRWDERPTAAAAATLLADLHVAIDGLALVAPLSVLQQSQELVWLARAAVPDPEKETDASVAQRMEANRTLLFRQRGELSDRRSDRRAWAAATSATVPGSPQP